MSTSLSAVLAGPDFDVEFDFDAPWRLHPQVSIRPERFGALLYHFGTRRLSFLKSPRLVAVVIGLAEAPDARAACARAGVAEAELATYRVALRGLAASHMICERTSSCERSAS